MMKREKDSETDVYFRTGRINCIDSQWYFLTREGENIGPFATREEAEKQLIHYLDDIKR